MFSSSYRFIVPAPLRRLIRERLDRRRNVRRAYSQEGEDLLLSRMFDSEPAGIYVDVGAHHPFRFSNTCLLHERGWRGINIDAWPGSMASFNRHRPHDRNLEIGISAHPQTLEYHEFKEPALNTFDAMLARERVAQGWPMTATRSVACRPLGDVLDEELPRLGATSIDLLSVDVEGLDLEVLESNDWRRFRPRALVVEILGSGLDAVVSSPVTRFCASVGYRPFSRLVYSTVFVPTDKGGSD
jgi:FkbM family methyltransferase